MEIHIRMSIPYRLDIMYMDILATTQFKQPPIIWSVCMISFYPQKWLSFLYLLPPVYACHPSFVFHDFTQASTHLHQASVDWNMAITNWGLNKMAVTLQTFASIFLEWEFLLSKIWYVLLKIHKILLLTVPIDNTSVLVQAMTWH